ncbi:KEOPS complex subunit Pcc1 [Natrialbaceae archaeon AArc-T1-2]|uniref:KEOPS complex subunit Pcc1 n=1 Tax=Natrialbaceae archaeon AArc-T1-2 TaxID=3053904 RepID=UPI00255AADD5|nr:KEOPS complex subunit Pcc1 [Natrialbaceae archaeon AArc-T1-2]WIV65733.1 KEOPS complex subunit Pcc1 [Natrialbaceae archaeon AArc-T1-2]
MFSHDATLEFAYEEETRARVVYDAVAREIGEIDDERSRARIDRDGPVLTLAVDARDRTALRAALNTWCTLIDVAERSTALGGRFETG